MAAKPRKDSTPAMADVMTMPVEVIMDSTPVFNLENMDKFDLSLPSAYAGATEVITIQE